jgi:hypothetical protein
MYCLVYYFIYHLYCVFLVDCLWSYGVFLLLCFNSVYFSLLLKTLFV